ncbi:MAG: tRNA (N6-threonylcarbamoyladenosine(37)-N6)-methyltransferase TrmO [Bdellovibrionaceae bacterium]|nr:tRNA (N6-threonylcarbamoyladenosine(37)-N6)-methyltransferase TrmO [Pseudobdellovibrionaceae bacterium]
MEPPVALTLEPIGHYHSGQKHPYEAARQPREDSSQQGVIRLQAGRQFEQALQDLEGFDRLWVIFQFHHNPHWKPMVFPPRGSDRKVGVFATRAPYRPNPLGLSCVRLLGIRGLEIFIEGADLLDGTPVFDLKPYLRDVDAHPEARLGWLEDVESRRWNLEWSPLALEKLRWLEDHGVANLKDFLRQQLEFEPFDDRRKRVEALPDADRFRLAYRTWRVLFLARDQQNLLIQDIASGYSAQDLSAPEDRWRDKELHRSFRSRFASAAPV